MDFEVHAFQVNLSCCRVLRKLRELASSGGKELNEQRQETVNLGFCEEGLGCRTLPLKASNLGEGGGKWNAHSQDEVL